MLTLVLGKGGVGRSTVARALAWDAARGGERAVCVELGSGGGHLTAAADGPTMRVLDPAQAVEAAAAPVFGSRRVARAVLGNFAMQRLLDVIPAIREYALLVAALELTTTTDTVVIDMPATGHGVAWLGAAERLARLVPDGRAREQADRLDAALRDRACTQLVVVTLPEPLVLAETLELRAALRLQLGRDADRIIVNRAPPTPPQAALLARAFAEIEPATASAARALATWLEHRDRGRVQAAAAAAGVATSWIDDGQREPALADLARALAASLVPSLGATP